MDKREYACFKRSMDWYAADPAFRHMMDSDPVKTVDRLGFTGILDPHAAGNAIRNLFFEGKPSDNAYVRAFYELQQPVISDIRRVHGRSCIGDERLYYYLDTQRNRCRMESRLIRSHSNIYFFPFAVELSHGCRPQCSFCGFQAAPYEGSFRHTPENAELFIRVIKALLRYSGELGGYCPCYFATEPFDNPDYELFMEDFKAVTGHIPQTTTALAHVYPDRIRRWMSVSGGYENRAAMRFSVCSLAQFREIMKNYSPEDLLYVELLANNPESVNMYSESGRARKEKSAEGKNRKAAPYSISCVAGVKVNMKDMTTAFMRPEIPDEDYPLGYRVFDEAAFSGVRDFEILLKSYMDRFVRGLLDADIPLCVNRHVSFKRNGENSVVFVNRYDGTSYETGSVSGLYAMIENAGLHRSFNESAALAGLTDKEAADCAGAFTRLVQRGYIDYYI